MANNQTFTLNIKALFDASDVKAKVGDIQKAFSNLRLPDNLKKNLDDSFTNLNKALSDFESRAAKGVKTKADAKGLTASMDSVIKEFTNIQKVAAQVRAELGDSVDLSKIIKLDDNTIKKLTDLQQQAKSLKDELANINTSKLQNLSNLLSKIKGEKTTAKAEAAFQLFKDGDIEGAIQKIDELIAKQKQLEGGAANRTGTITTNLEQLNQVRTEMVNAAQQAKGKTEELGRVTQQQADVAKAAFDKEVQSVNNANQGLAEYGNRASAASGQVSDLAANQVRLNTELDQVKSRIQYFFGLANSINLVKRAIRSAFDTVKELDAAMTETAVVTDHTISDMWQKLPEYTKRANQLGVSTLAAYQSATLYYQQGLNDAQAGELSVETLKMARIAGLEAADATDRMTNALRGFNMELNTTSAQRVDDVYSQLAAMSASNVDEISTAMTKVASLAHSANMEFETTAAFLAQIIETTRESAETAGTALKTVAARFSEVKKLVDTDQLKGTDEEGQVVDVNKVSAALRTAGIDLNKYFLGEVGLDDIFMELASKWDSLTNVQQRYIATQAAGSRQQSRFIALMQDYARTQQLVSAAYNAEGASARQFEKTQDSLQSKLARLKNAWNEFLMGITNSGVIKSVVDALTTLLNIINKLTGAFGPAASGFLKFGVAAAAVIGGKKAFSNGGIATKAIGALGNTKVGSWLGFGGNTNTQITAAGAGFKTQVDAAGADFAAAVRGAAGVQAAGQTGSPTVQTLTLGQRLTQFKKQSTITPLSYQNLSPAEKIRQASTSGVPVATPKTLFGALGNRFAGTKIGSGIQGTLAKIPGIGSVFAGAAGGAATLAATIGTITVAAGAAAIAIKAMYDASPAGQLKIAEKYADAMSDVAANAQKAASKIRDIAANTKEYESAIKDATSTSDREKAIQDQNEYILSILEEDATYAQYIQSTFTEGGQLYLTLDSDALAAAVDKIAEGATRASAHSQLAKAIAQQQTADYYRNKLTGIDLVNRTKTVGAGDYQTQVRLTDEEYAKYLGYQQKIDTANIAMQNYATTAAFQLVNTDKVGSELAQGISEAIGVSFNADEILKTTRGQDIRETLFNWGRQDLEIRYRELYGADASGLKRSDLIDKVAMGEALQEAVEDPISNLETILTSGNEKNARTILDGIIGQGDLLTTNLLGNAELDEGQIYEILGFGSEDTEDLASSLVEFATALGISTDQLRDLIKNRAKEVKLNQERRAKQTSEQLLNNGVSSENIAHYLTLGNVEDQELFANIVNSLGSGATDSFVSELLNNINSADWSGSELQDWINSINLENPIQAFGTLKKAATDSTGAVSDSIKSAAQSILDAGEATGKFSASAQLAYLTTSDGYDELTESLAEFKEENGKISSANIKELAESNGNLNSLLENNVMTAKALAVALEGIESGEIQVWDLNDAVIAALNSMDDLDGIVQSTIEDLNGFDPGFDENDITGFITNVYETISKNLENGAIGNNQNKTYLEKIFGPDIFDFGAVSVDEYGRKYEAKVQELTGILEANQESMYSAWQSALGTYTTASGETLEIFNKGNEVFIEGAQVTTDELVEIVAKATGLGEQWARMMVTDYKNFSPDFAYQQGLIDLEAGIQSWYDNLATLPDGQKIYDLTDLDTLAKLFNVSKEDIQNAINGLGESAEELRGIDWTGGKTGTEGISNVLANAREVANETGLVFDELVGKINTKTKEVENVVVPNFNAMQDAFSQMGIGQYFDAAFEEAAQSAGQFTRSILGETRTINIEEGQTAGEAYADAYQQAVNQDLAGKLSSAIQESFGEGFEIKLNADESGIQILTTTEEKLALVQDGITAVNSTSADISVTDGQVRDAIISVNNLNTAIQNAQNVASAGINIPTTIGERGGLATGGIVRSYGAGSEHFHVQPGTALTGEEDPEIIWNKEKGYAYITGQNGPEFQNLQPGDRVFNADETKKILKNSSLAKGGIVPSFARGYDKATKPGSGGSGSNSGSKDKAKKESTWRNELDWLYDLMEDIAEYERQQTIIQSKYELALSDLGKTGRDLFNLTRQELRNLNTQYKAQSDALLKRTQQMGELQTLVNSKGFQKYVQWNQKDQTLEINWDKIEAIQDKEKYDEVTEFINRMEEVQDQMDDAEKALYDIKKQIQELEERFLQQYLDFQKRVLDAVVKQYQTTIDNLSELNDTLNDANSSILDSLQKEIDLQRQIRDNTDTEQNIADMEARLAYLQRDTTGANAQEIRELEKQLSDARQDYSDTLIDQEIDRLNEANDTATTQREKQIELMQAQLDYWQESGGLWNEVADLIAGGFTNQGTIISGSDLWEVLKQADSWEALSEAQKKNWANELILETNEVGAHLIQLSGGNAIDFEKVRDSIATNGDLAIKAINAGADTVRASIASLKGKMGGTPAHSYTAEKTEGYASGGTATSTAMALLHGTPQEPEYVLNARQTDAFLRLADILPAAMGGNTNTPSNVFGGDTIFNIGINVDSIANDYDVDQLVERIKDDLADAAGYRNVNALSFIR